MSLAVRIWVDRRPSPRIVVRAPYECRDVLEAVAGARWDAGNRVRVYPASPHTARALLAELAHYPEWVVSVDDDVKDLLSRAELEVAAVDHKSAEDLAEIPGRLPSWLHQRQAYHFAFEWRFTFFDMYMGSGKSRVTISLLDGWEAELCIILAPRSVLAVWPNQFATHSERDWLMIVPSMKLSVPKRVEAIKDELFRAALHRPKLPLAIVVNYEAAWRQPMGTFLLELELQNRTPVVLDESHRIKSPGGTASKWCARLTKHAGRRLNLTGTPMPHSPMDLYAQFRAGDPGVFGTSFHRYKHRYGVMGGFEGRQVVAYQRQDELSAKFAEHAYIFTQADLRRLGSAPASPST